MSAHYAAPKPDNAVDFERFTAIGRPMGSAPSVAVGGSYGGGFAGPAGMGRVPQSLPHRFTDESVIQVPVRISDLQDPDDHFDEWWATVKKESATKKRGIKAAMRSLLLRAPAGAKKGEFVMLDMTRADYLRYCAKDEKGKYIGTEPQSESRRVLREMATRQQEGRSASTASAPMVLRSTANARGYGISAAFSAA